jgi:dTMP kinase
MFIVFEGIDGSGTTTQARILANKIASLGCDVLSTREPGGTPLAEKIRDLVLDPAAKELHFSTELFLYAASRTQHIHERILPAIEGGTTVICDRFTPSTLAYQGYGRSLDLETVRKVAALAESTCRPDLVIYLDLAVEEAISRRKNRLEPKDRLEQEGSDFQHRVAKGYRLLAAENPLQSYVANASASSEVVATEIWSYLKSRWPRFPLKD